jgi:hypothetical protein
MLKQVRQAALPIVRAVSLAAGVAHAASLPSHHIPTLDAARTVVAAAVLAGVELAPRKADMA